MVGQAFSDAIRRDEGRTGRPFAFSDAASGRPRSVRLRFVAVHRGKPCGGLLKRGGGRSRRHARPTPSLEQTSPDDFGVFVGADGGFRWPFSVTILVAVSAIERIAVPSGVAE